MSQDRRKLYWFVALLIISGGGALLLRLPFALTATTAPADQMPPALTPNAYEPEVQELLETTYLGHAGQEPDPGEPAIVLRKYIEQNAHGYLEGLSEKDDQAELDSQITAWENLRQQYPQSRHAHIALGRLYRIKAIAARERSYMQKAADAFTRGTEIGVQNGHIRHTHELSEVLVELQDIKRLERVFGKLLAQPKNQTPKESYIALVDYADALAKLDDNRAWAFFEEALDLWPENNQEALNRYAGHLLNKGQAKKALAVLDEQTTKEQRVQSGLQARLRRRALQEVGLDTASVDVEVRESEEQLTQAEYGYSATLPSTTTEPAWAIPELVDTTGNILSSKLFLVFNAGSPPPLYSAYMSDRYLSPVTSFTGGATRVSAFRLPHTPQGRPRAGVAVIGSGNGIYYRFYDGTAWSNWTQIPGAGKEIAAIGRPNGEVHLFIVGTDNYIYQNRSLTGQPGSWLGWRQHPCCVSKIAAAALLDGTIYIAAQASTAALGYGIYWISTSDGVNYPTTGWQSLGPLPGSCPNCLANDLTVLAYKPNVSGSSTVAIAAVGADQCTVYQKHKFFSPSQQWDATWFPFSTAPCYKSVSSFTTFRQLSSTTVTEEGAFLAFTGRFDSQLYTLQHNGSAWLSPRPAGTTPWASAAGADFTDFAQLKFVHNGQSDDCRAQDTRFGSPACIQDPSNPNGCYFTQTVNLAEILYNEARGENTGGRALVGWTVRNRARQGLTCDAYPGMNTDACLSSTVCPDNLIDSRTGLSRCPQSRKDCCAMHGGTSSVGQSTSQFNDGHVSVSQLESAGLLRFALRVFNGWIPDPATGFVPPGITGCVSTTTCGNNLICSQTSGNYTDADPTGPTKYRGCTYTPTASSCKRPTNPVYLCGNSPVQCRYTCGAPQPPDCTFDNYFWLRNQ
ncbi:MAG TPA: hypothetical protein VNN62_08425 [Methylomirabilota bacterium]|nr:hypothetical protein [Methylomirabilota bacterium]